MRRGPSRMNPAEHSRRRGEPRRGRTGVLADRVRSAPPLVKLAGASVLGLGLYVVFSLRLGGGAAGNNSGVGVRVGAGGVLGGGGTVIGGGGEGKEWGLRRRFRQLSMLGFESEGGKGGEWKTCRAFEETGLAPHKKVGQAGHDPFLRQVKPTPGAKWELAMSEDQDTEWLGLHQWDDRFKHGSEEADRRVKELGYCRVHMPSVPRTGSTWFRAMFEAATGQPSFSMWQEGGTFKEKYKAFSSDDPCGASLDHMEGRLQSKKVFPCRDMRPPNASSPILYKSHTPFFPSYNKPSLMPEQTCMLLLLVRNPIDNQDAWTRYMAGKGQPLREYLPIWQGHLSHWIAAAGDIPIYVFRYEDMLYRAEDVLRRILQTLPGGWVWSEESIAKAMRMYGPQKPFEDKCGSGLKKASVAEVNMVREHYGSYMRHLGYRFIKK